MRTAIVATIVAAALASSADAQFQRRGGRFGFGPRIPENPQYDGAFMFCRIMFRNASNGDGGGWGVDYPKADQNLSYRLSELTTTSVSRNPVGDFNHAVIRLTDEAFLSHCPFIMMTEPGGAFLDDDEAASLRLYLQKGGFLWADDFWGEYAWEHWLNEIRKALPSSDYPLMDVPLEHPLFHTLYDVHEIPQIPSIGFWYGSGFNTSERGRDSAEFDGIPPVLRDLSQRPDEGQLRESLSRRRRSSRRFRARGNARKSRPEASKGPDAARRTSPS